MTKILIKYRNDTKDTFLHFTQLLLINKKNNIVIKKNICFCYEKIGNKNVSFVSYNIINIINIIKIYIL